MSRRAWCGVLGAAWCPLALAAWLGVCPAPQGEAGVRTLARYVDPQGGHSSLVLAAAALPGCSGSELALDADAVAAGRLLAPELGDLGPGFTAIGSPGPQGFALGEIIALELPRPPRAPPPPKRPIPVGNELATGLNATVFGNEGRASVVRERGRPVLQCAAGQQVAGALLELPYLGAPTGLPLALALGHQASGRFALGVSDAARANGGDPLPLGAVGPTGPSGNRQQIALPSADFDLRSLGSITLACPFEAARFELEHLSLQPASAPPRLPARALWAWQASAWRDQPDALLDKLARSGADTVFMTVPVDLPGAAVQQPEQLAAFVSRARQRGVLVWAVVGDPDAVLEQERESFASLTRAYNRYNQGVAPAARLAGVQFDIEPHLNPGYALDPARWLEAFLVTLYALKRSSELPVDVAVPFWWADQITATGPLLERLAPLVDSLTVMNYRTDPAQIKSLAQPFLEWGARHRHAVRVALEYGPIADQVQRHFRPAASGPVALVTIERHRVLLELNQGTALAPAPPGVQRFAASHDTHLPGSLTTFAGRRETLLGLLPSLEKLWSAWPGFAGTALHEYEP